MPQQVVNGRYQKANVVVDPSKPFLQLGGPRPGAGHKPVVERALLDAAVTESDWLKIYKVVLGQALKGDIASCKWLADRRFGKPKESLEISGPEGGMILMASLMADIKKLDDTELIRIHSESLAPPSRDRGVALEPSTGADPLLP